MKEIKSALVCGAGTMGRGIAQWLVQQNIQVTLIDQTQIASQSACELISQSWDQLAKKNKFSKEQINFLKKNLLASVKEKAPKKVDLLIEAVFEDFKVKEELFSYFDHYLDPQTIFASNTSSFSINTLATSVNEQRQKKFLGLHFFNPAPIMKLVEVIQGEETDPQLMINLGEWLKKSGKEIAFASDAPGFIVNRVARNFYGESLRVLGNQDEDRSKKIDQIMREIGGFRMGPFELMDLIGIDINYQVTCSVWDAFFKEPRFAPHHLQKSLVERGHLGKKTKKGFYSYDK